MDYVFGVMSPGESKITAGIWPELKYFLGAAASIMEQCAEMALMHGEIEEALGIMNVAMSLPDHATEESFNDMENKDNALKFKSEHFYFVAMSLEGLKRTMEDYPDRIYIPVGSDHRKCPYVDECTKTPTAEQLANGWVPWETEEAKS